LKLQSFLNVFEGENLSYTGIYDKATFDAVSRFQEKYSEDILAPWGSKVTTGFTYILTKKKVNEIYCGSAFPINAVQQNEIESFKNSSDSNKDTSAIGQTKSSFSSLSDRNATTTVSHEGAPPNPIVVNLKDNSPTTTESVTRNAAISLFALPQKILGNGRYITMVLILIAIIISIVSLFTSKGQSEDSSKMSFIEQEDQDKEQTPIIPLLGETLFPPDEEIMVENPDEEFDVEPAAEPEEESEIN
jgi:hypothetical protein